MQITSIVMFWVCVTGVVYAYAGYPLLICACARLFASRSRSPDIATAELPSVSLLIIAHNEEAVIEQRLRNALEMDYPPQQLEIVVASDGSSDETTSIVRRFSSAGVRLLDFPQRRGKASTLNDAISHLNGEIVLFSDADTFTHPSAALKLARWFAEPDVGVACGRIILTDDPAGRNADGAYWKYETFVKRCEGRLGALIGASGAIYAMRRGLFCAIPDNTLVEDLVLPLHVKLHSGCRIIYDCEALAFGDTAPSVRDEFRRRARIGAGGFQAIVLLWRLLSLRHGWMALAFFSHKVLRWVCPFLLIGALVFSAALYTIPLYRTALVAQLGFYLLSLAGARVVGGRGRVSRLLRTMQMFTIMNLALLVGFARWVRGRQNGTWVQAPRAAGLRRAA